MKCPKCGYNSFDYLESCKKCGSDLAGHKIRFGLSSFLFSGRGRAGASLETQREVPPAAASLDETATGRESKSSDSRIDFGESSFPSWEDGGIDPTESLEPDVQPDDDHAPVESLPAKEDLELDFSWGEKSAPEVLPNLSSGDEPLNFDTGAELSDEKKEEPLFSFATLEEPAQDKQTSTPLGNGSPRVPMRETLPEMEAELDFSGMFSDSPAEEGAKPEEVSAIAEPLTSGDFSFGTEMPEFEPPESEISVEDAFPCDEMICEPAVSPPAPVVRRIAAGGIDLLVLALVFVPFVAAGGILLSPADGEAAFTAALIDLSIPYFLVFFVVAFSYYTLFHFLTGQTPGKMLLKLRVEGIDGDSLFFSEAFLRSVGGLLSLLPAGAGFLFILTDTDRRGWGDRLAGSRVVVSGMETLEEGLLASEQNELE